MGSANDNSGKPRRVRDGVLQRWPNADIAQIASDEALLRLANARNAASQSANRFMLLAAVIAFLYFLRLQGIAADLKFGEYRLANLPFGLFLLSVCATVLSTVSLVRQGDARSYDRYLKLGCEQKYDSGCDLRYQAFPNPNAWGEPFSMMMHMPRAGGFAVALREIALFLINLFLLLLVVAPLLSALDFLWGNRALADEGFQTTRRLIVLFLSIANIATLCLVSWARIADRD